MLQITTFIKNLLDKPVNEIIAATKSMAFEQATYYIENTCGLDVERIHTLSTCILWRVNHNSEICYISNSYMSLVTGMSDVKAVWS